MTHIQRPVRAIVRPPRQVQSSEYQDSGRNDNISDYHDALRDLIARQPQVRGQYPRLLNNLATLIMDVSWLNHRTLLPLFNNCPELVVSPSSVELDEISRPGHVAYTQSQDHPLQSRVESPSNISIQEDISTSRPSSGPRRRLNVRSAVKEKHDKREKEILEVLRPIVPEEQIDFQWILLCYGKSDQCQIIPVDIPISADSVTVWNEIQHTWNNHTGSWRRSIPYFGVRKVSVIDVSIIGRASRPPSNGIFIGAYRKEDLEASRKNLAQEIADHEPQESPCAYDPASGRTQCNDDCGSWFGFPFQCPEETLRSAERDLSRLNMRQTLVLAFSDPHVAMGNNLLPEDLFLTTKDILAEIRQWHCPSVAELKFRGLLIEEGWDLHLDPVKLPLAVTTLLLSVVGAWFIYGDWSVAWTVGCFGIALMGLWKRWAGVPRQHH